MWGFLGGVSGRAGAAAEYVAVKPSSISKAPEGVDPVAAAALPSVGEAALLALRKLRLGAGDRLLVIGASGGVGSSAVQLACAAGVRVTAVTSACNEDFCRDLGATAVLDYVRIEHAELQREFDAILDCHGTDLSRYRHALVRGGRMVTTSPDAIGFAPASLFMPGPRVRVLMTRPQHAALLEVAAYVERGALRPRVDATYSLDTIADGHRKVETGHARGKRVVRVLEPSISDIP